jgi:hypothetical protein
MERRREMVDDHSTRSDRRRGRTPKPPKRGVCLSPTRYVTPRAKREEHAARRPLWLSLTDFVRHGVHSKTRSPYRRARRAAAATLFPPSVFPLWKPPFQIPPFSKESTKGGKPRGAPARRSHGADGGMEPLHLHALHGRSGLAVRAPPPSGLPPPLRRSAPFAPSAPRGGARWSGRHRLSPFRASTRWRPFVESPTAT